MKRQTLLAVFLSIILIPAYATASSYSTKSVTTSSTEQGSTSTSGASTKTSTSSNSWNTQPGSSSSSSGSSTGTQNGHWDHGNPNKPDHNGPHSSPTPAPAAIILLTSGVGLLGIMRRKYAHK